MCLVDCHGNFEKRKFDLVGLVDHDWQKLGKIVKICYNILANYRWEVGLKYMPITNSSASLVSKSKSLRSMKLLVLLALLLSGAASYGQRIGPDIEDYRPPFSNQNSTVAEALAAYDAGNDLESERLARKLLSRALSQRKPDMMKIVEARFILAQALGGQKRLTEAEIEYRLGLKLLEPYFPKNGISGKPDAKALATAHQWVGYFEILLKDNLKGQGRYRESELIVSLLPVEPRRTYDSMTDQAVSSLPPIKIDPCSNSVVGLRPMTQAEAVSRDEWSNAAISHSISGDWPSAERELRKKLVLDGSIFGPDHCETAVDHRQLAQSLFQQNRWTEAEIEARKALDILDQLQAEDRQTGFVLGVLADIVTKSGQASAGEPFLRRAVSIFEQRDGRVSQAAIDARLDLAANLYAQGRLRESEEIYRSSLASGRLIDFDNDEERSLEIQEFIAYLADRQNRNSDAVRDYEKVCARRAELRSQSGRGGAVSLLESEDQAAMGSCKLRQAFAMYRLAEKGGGNIDSNGPEALLARAFEAAQLASVSPAAETLARASARIAAAQSDAGELAERYEAAIRTRDESGLAPIPLWRDRYATYSRTFEERAARDRQDQEIAGIAAQLAQLAPLYWQLRTPQTLSIASLQARHGPDRILLGKDEAIVLFLVPPGNQYGLVFAISKDNMGWSRIGMTGEELAGDIAGLRAGIDSMAYGVSSEIRAQGPGYQPFDRQLAYKLYQALFGSDEIQRVIAKPKTLIIVPSGPLTTLPPGLLVTRPPQGGAGADDNPVFLRQTGWLLRDKAIALLPSVASLRTVRQLTSRRKNSQSIPLLAFTNPDFSGKGDALSSQEEPAGQSRAPGNFTSYFRNGKPSAEALRTLSPLPNTWKEGMALAAALHSSSDNVLAGTDASKAELMTRNRDGRLARVRVLEFATHGLVAGIGDDLAEPALVLAAGEEPEDWLLTASEAAALRLNADWVLLSACNTASPDLSGAEGLSGLVKSFFYAGASALLVSHWTVSDESTAKLVPMVIALGQSRRNLSRAEALREASLAILDDADEDYSHPVYWAPFTLIGDASRF